MGAHDGPSRGQVQRRPIHIGGRGALSASTRAGRRQPPRHQALGSVLVSFTPVRGRSPASALIVFAQARTLADGGERWRTGVNETKTEPRAWCRGAAADRPACLPIAPIADVNPRTLNLASAGPSWAPSAVSSAAMKPDPCSSRTASAWQEGVCGGRLGPYPELVEKGYCLPAELVVPDAFGDEVDPGPVDERDERGLVHQLVIDPCP